MRFSQFTTLLATTAAVVNAQISAEQVVTDLSTLTQLSSEGNTIASGLSLINFLSSAPQLVNQFLTIVQLTTNDIANEVSKRSLTPRQECLDLLDLGRCIDDILEILNDPAELLGRKRAVEARQATAYTEAEQFAVCNAYSGFVTAHEQLLNTLIAKHGLLSLTPFTTPIGQVLRALEGDLDVYSTDILNTVPLCAGDLGQNKNSLDMTYEQATGQYSS